MPSTEYVAMKITEPNVVFLSRHLRSFLLFVCPVCKCYTIHAPRLNRKGYWYIDHKRVPVHQLQFDGEKKYVGLAPEEACFIRDNLAVQNIETTRTVIRVK